MGALFNSYTSRYHAVVVLKLVGKLNANKERHDLDW